MSTDRTGISVILPTHNRAAMLGRAIDSVLTQTYSDLELIVVDDGSTDGTAELLAAVDDPRLVTIELPGRSGAAVARNTGIRHARGELVAFQDSDDEWIATKLEQQLALLRRGAPAVGAVGGRYRIGKGADAVQIDAPQLESGRDYETELLDGPCLITPLWLIRRTLLEELGLFDERMPCLEDWDLMLRLSRQTSMCAVPETVLIKYGAADSLGADVDRRQPAMEEILARHRARFRAHPARYSSFCLELADLSLQRGLVLSSLRYAAQAQVRGETPPGAVPAHLRRAARHVLRAGRAATTRTLRRR